MEILRPAVAGTLESSDCQVTVEEGEGKIELTLEQCGDQSVWKSDQESSI